MIEKKKQMKPLIPANSRGLYGIGPWVTIEFEGKSRPAIVTKQKVHIKENKEMIEIYEVRIVTVTKEWLEESEKKTKEAMKKMGFIHDKVEP